MVDTPTLINPDYKDLNLALNIVAKCGLAPWVLPESIPRCRLFLAYLIPKAVEDRVNG